MRSIQEILAPLASLKMQERHIVGGTKDEYLLPEELLNHALEALAKRNPIAELSAVQVALAACDPLADISASQLVHEYVPWVTLRRAAQSYLQSSGFNLEQWEANEL